MPWPKSPRSKVTKVPRDGSKRKYVRFIMQLAGAMIVRCVHRNPLVGHPASDFSTALDLSFGAPDLRVGAGAGQVQVTMYGGYLDYYSVG